MSQFDHGKHPKNDDGTPVFQSRRLDAQKPSRQLLSRQTVFDQELKSIDVKRRDGFNRPGSQNRNK